MEISTKRHAALDLLKRVLRMRECLMEASKRGFPANVSNRKGAVVAVTGDGKEVFKNKNQPIDYVRSWRARNRDMSLRKVENRNRW